MKKFLLLAVCAFTSLMSMGKEFTDQLTVTINGESTSQQTTVIVEELQDNYINFVLSNFVLGAEDDEMYVGNIEVNDLFLQDKGDYKTFSYNAHILIKPGKRDDLTEDDWLGPLLGSVPLVLKGKLAEDKVYVSIDIDMQKDLGQTIFVEFGQDIPNNATVVSTTDYTATQTASGMVNFGEDYGQVMPFSPTADLKATVETLTSNDINLVVTDFVLGMGEETFPLGVLKIENVEVSPRLGYCNFEGIGETTIGGEGQFAGLTLPYVLKGKYSDTQLCYELLLVVDAMQMDLTFTYGEDFAPITTAGDAAMYSDKLTVTVDDDSTEPMDATVEVTPLTNGGINFTLKNFKMTLNGDEMPVGNITVEDIPVFEGDGYQYFNYTGNLTIPAGDQEGVDEADWIGPMLGDIPLRMKGRMTNDKLYVTIDIDMVSLEQIISVVFGTDIETAITAVKSDNTFKSDAIYDLCGRRVARATKGIYIVGGKKVMF